MINEKNLINDPVSLKKQFQSEKEPTGPYIYLPMDCGLVPGKIEKLIAGYKKSGYSGIIPFTDKNSVVKALTREYYDMYDRIKKEADACQMKLGYLDDSYVMREYIAAQDNAEDVICKILTKYEYSCIEGEKIKINLHRKGKLMSLVAVNDIDLTVTDLRTFAVDNVLEWQVPDGNWNIEEYVCEPDMNAHVINTLDYDISLKSFAPPSASLQKIFQTVRQ